MQTGLTTTTRSREPSRKPGDRSIGTTAASGPPNRKRRKPLSISALQGQTESGRAQRRKRNRIFNENTTIFSMEIKARFDHFNINVTDLERSLAFYDRALGLKEISRKQADDGSFILAYLGDGETGFRLELTWLRDHAATPYELGENESQLLVVGAYGFVVARDADAEVAFVLAQFVGRRGRLRSRTRLPQGAGMRLLRKPRNGTLLHQRSGRLLDRSAAPEPLTQDGSRESLRSGSIRKFEKHYGNGNHGTGRDGGRPDPS